jgi:hypothetical protein
MSESILTDVKKALGLSSDYDAFDPDIIMHINSILTILNDLGVGPDSVLVIEGAENTWTELGLPDNQLSTVKVYLYLKVRLAFDPPTMGFHIDALNKQIEEHEYRLKERREALVPIPEREDWEVRGW